jgi:hypothetical protein
MKRLIVTAVLASLLIVPGSFISMADAGEGQRMAKDAAITAGRASVGTAIGGTVGKVVTGSPAGTIAGGLLSSTPTATDRQEMRARENAIRENMTTCGRPTYCGAR